MRTSPVRSRASSWNLSAGLATRCANMRQYEAARMLLEGGRGAMSQGVPDEIIPVWPDEVPDAELWHEAGPELERPLWESSRLVRNVSQPTLMVFQPEPSLATG